VVGNDIVDLQFADSPCYQHVAHIGRVCTPDELTFVHNADEPSIVLASMWVSKEAAYKLISKSMSCRFVPRQFAVSLTNPDEATAARAAIVSYAGIATRVELSVCENWVHAVAVSPAVQVVRWAVRDIEKCFSGDRRATDESEAVRFLATERSANYFGEDVLLNFQGRTPILVHPSGGRAGVDVSFSHHGRFAAVAMAWPARIERPTRNSAERCANLSRAEEMCFTCTA